MMARMGVKVAFDGEREPHDVSTDMTPEQLAQAEMLDLSYNRLSDQNSLVFVDMPALQKLSLQGQKEYILTLSDEWAMPLPCSNYGH